MIDFMGNLISPKSRNKISKGDPRFKTTASSKKFLARNIDIQNQIPKVDQPKMVNKDYYDYETTFNIDKLKEEILQQSKTSRLIPIDQE